MVNSLSTCSNIAERKLTAVATAFLLAFTTTTFCLAAEIPPDNPARRVLVSKFQDWSLTCDTQCHAETRLHGANSDAEEILRLSIAGGPMPRLTLHTALPLYLPDGIGLSLGTSQALESPWSTCDASGCEAWFELSPVLLEALRRERSGFAAFTILGGERVRLNVSLLGVSSALSALSEVQDP